MGTDAPGGRRLRAGARLLAAASRRIAAVEPELGALPTIVKPGDVCLDVGAKHGAYALVMAAAAGPTGRTVAFEPLPGPRRVMRTGRLVLGAENVEVVASAVADVIGTAELQVPVRRGLAVTGRSFLALGTDGLGSNVEFRRHRSVTTPVTTLDVWCAAAGLDRVDVMKLDVEGAEARVLAGAAGLLERHHPTVLIELEDRHLSRFRTSAADVLHHLLGLGYRAAVLEDGRWRPDTAPSGTVRNHLLHHPARWGKAPVWLGAVGALRA